MDHAKAQADAKVNAHQDQLNHTHREVALHLCYLHRELPPSSLVRIFGPACLDLVAELSDEAVAVLLIYL